jgi:hypothetical protein
VEPEQEGVEVGVVAGAGGGVDDLGESMVGEGSAVAGEAAWLGDSEGRVVGVGDEVVCGGVAVEAWR